MPEDTLTAPAPSVGAEGGGSSPETTPSPSVVEEPQGGAQPGAEPGQPEPGAGPEPGTDADQQPQGGADEESRTLPKHIRALKETDPQAFKQAKAQFFEHREYKNAFPTVQDARAAREIVESVGGQAGLQELLTDRTFFKEAATQFLDGDEQFVKTLAEEDPTAFASHAGTFLSTLQQVDRPAYNRTMAKQFATEFTAAGIWPRLVDIYNAVNQGKKDEAIAKLEEVAGWHDRIVNLAKQEENPEVKRLREQIKRDREDRAKEGERSFHVSYRTDADKHVSTETDRLFNSYTKDRTVDEESRNILRNNIQMLANEMLLKDKAFMEGRDRLFKLGDKAALLRFVNAEVTKKIELAAPKVMRAFGRPGAAAPPAKPAAQGTNGAKPGTPGARPAADAAFVKVNARPNGLEIDRTRTPASMIINEKKAYLRDGRKVTWAHLQ